jgi:hypothetical protein
MSAPGEQVDARAHGDIIAHGPLLDGGASVVDPAVLSIMFARRI